MIQSEHSLSTHPQGNEWDTAFWILTLSDFATLTATGFWILECHSTRQIVCMDVDYRFLDSVTLD